MASFAARPGWLLSATSVAALAVAGACTTVQEASAGPTGCPAEQIRIYGLRTARGAETWTAECREGVFDCWSGASDYAINARCRRRSTVEAPPTPRVAARPRPSASEVLRELEGQGDASPVENSSGTNGKVLTTRFSEGSFGFALLAKPNEDPGNVRLTISVPPALVGESCELRIMLDGEILAPFEKAKNAPPDRGRLYVDVPVATLIRFVPFHRVVGRVCDSEFRLQPASQDRIRELLLRMDEELKWLGKPGLPLEKPSNKPDETYRL